jgi:hypothetical protein
MLAKSQIQGIKRNAQKKGHTKIIKLNHLKKKHKKKCHKIYENFMICL